jgi:hypothetical protein
MRYGKAIRTIVSAVTTHKLTSGKKESTAETSDPPVVTTVFDGFIVHSIQRSSAFVSYRLLQQAIDGLCHFTETASARRISLLARAHPVFDESGDTLRNGRLSSGFDLISKVLLVKAETVAKSDQAVFFFQPDAYSQIVGRKMMLTRKVNHLAIRRGAETILAFSGLIKAFRLEH